jgi:hypothetical protein
MDGQSIASVNGKEWQVSIFEGVVRLVAETSGAEGDVAVALLPERSDILYVIYKGEARFAICGLEGKCLTPHSLSILPFIGPTMDSSTILKRSCCKKGMLSIGVTLPVLNVMEFNLRMSFLMEKLAVIGSRKYRSVTLVRILKSAHWRDWPVSTFAGARRLLMHLRVLYAQMDLY